MTLHPIRDPRTGFTVWAEPEPPTECDQGHVLADVGCTVGWLPCTCNDAARGHRTHRCNADGCGRTHYRPPHHDDRAKVLAG